MARSELRAGASLLIFFSSYCPHTHSRQAHGGKTPHPPRFFRQLPALIVGAELRPSPQDFHRGVSKDTAYFFFLRRRLNAPASDAAAAAGNARRVEDVVATGSDAPVEALPEWNLCIMLLRAAPPLHRTARHAAGARPAWGTAAAASGRWKRLRGPAAITWQPFVPHTLARAAASLLLACRALPSRAGSRRSSASRMPTCSPLRTTSAASPPRPRYATTLAPTRSKQQHLCLATTRPRSPSTSCLPPSRPPSPHHPPIDLRWPRCG